MKIILRIIADCVLLGLIFVVPWWLAVLLIAAGIFLFHNFYEAFVFALFLNGFHGVTGVSFFGYNSYFIFIIGVIFIVAAILKNRLKFYS
jgi:hypothetical protein